MNKTQTAAVERIIFDCRSTDPSRSAVFSTSYGSVITDGHVLFYTPECIKSQPLLNAADLGHFEKWVDLLETAHNATTDQRYEILEPFKLWKISTSVRKLCAEHGFPLKYGPQAITFVGRSKSGASCDATFLARHLINAVEAIGVKQFGDIRAVPNIRGGKPFIYINHGPANGAFAEHMHAIIIPII